MTSTLLVQGFVMVTAKKSSSALQSPESEVLLELKKSKKKAAKKEKSQGGPEIEKEKKGKKTKKAEKKSGKKARKAEKKARKAAQELGDVAAVVTLVDTVSEEFTPAEVTAPAKPSPSPRKKKSAEALPSPSAAKPRRRKETPSLPENSVTPPPPSALGGFLHPWKLPRHRWPSARHAELLSKKLLPSHRSLPRAENAQRPRNRPLFLQTPAPYLPPKRLVALVPPKPFLP